MLHIMINKQASESGVDWIGSLSWISFRWVVVPLFLSFSPLYGVW
jgi:hypothetical protein